MRSVGAVDRPSASTGDHICWAFRDPAEIPEFAVPFLCEGLEKNEQLMFVADGTERELRAALHELGDVDGLVASGTLRLASTRNLYESDGELDQAARVRGYREVTKASVDAGYTGFRLFADATVLAAEPADRRRMVDYELDVDRVMAQFPMTAICAYDSSVLGGGVRELCAVHPGRHATNDDPGFCLSQQPGGLRLAGDIDLANADLFAMALDVAAVVEVGDVCIDSAALDFMHVPGLVELDRYAGRLAASGRTLHLDAAPQRVIRHATLLGLPALTAALAAR